MINQTIAAIATPLGPGGIGIVRVSGVAAHGILKRLFKRPPRVTNPSIHDLSDVPFRSHLVYYGFILDPVKGTIIDEVLAVYMKGPKSFTREDVVEIHSHSGFVVLDRILSAVVDSGAVLAGPGDFTKRAFLNGRIDLSQAEAIVDLINAPCEIAAHMASQQVTGDLRDVVETLTASLTGLRARCEASIEFSEDDGEDELVSAVCTDVRCSFLPSISALIQRQKETAIFREGLHLTITGSPNVGKSSLLNKLVQREAAIVSEVPGTTRDIVREYLSINGVPVILCDTAGIHDTSDPIECIGIEKARDQIHRSDMVLLVLDASRKMNEFEDKLINDIKKHNCLIVLNKDDVVDASALVDVKKKLRDFSVVRVSAKDGTNIEKLKELIFKDIVLGKGFNHGAGATPNLRQRKLLEQTKEELLPLSVGGGAGLSVELVSGRLGAAIDCLEKLSGNREKEDLYDHIFREFCVGK